MKTLLITAHTGCNGTPHNTIESILAGAAWGADINEIDVRATRDEIPVLWHDDALATKKGIIKVEDLTFREIEELSGAGEIEFPHPEGRITPLEEVFDAVAGKGIRLNMDLKDDECIVPVAKMVKTRDLAEDVVFSGCGKVRDRKSVV